MSNARTITLALHGTWYGSYGLAFCPAHANANTPALRVADGHDGRLLAVCAAGCPFSDVAASLRGLGLLEGRGAAFTPDPFAVAERQAEERREREKRTAQARRLWEGGQPIAGTLAETYLRGRGITCPLPASLRFHPQAWHGATAKKLPAMVAAVSLEGQTEPVAVHRTYLEEPGRKASIEPNKAMLGPVAGGAVRLTEGSGPLVVAEGIETALSLVCGLLRVPATIWAALSTSGMRGLHLPPEPGRLTIAPDGDGPGRAAAHHLAERAHALGWNVSLFPAPDGRDWNDILAMKGEGA